MEKWAVALLIFGAVAIAMIGQGWVSLLEHRRRRQAMDVIKAAIEHGKEAPPVIYEQLRRPEDPRSPWTEVIVFTTLSAGFWFAVSQSEGDQRLVFLFVAATMSVTALVCFALALVRLRASKRDEER